MKTAVLAAAIVMLVSLMGIGTCSATPSQEFYERDGEVYDDWDVCRTRGWGSDGYFEIYVNIIDREWVEEFRSPTIVLESLGENADLAYRLAEGFVQKYPHRLQLAEKIFEYVRDHVQYTNDWENPDQFELDEFALNADELAGEIEEEYLAEGDCEDYAILLAAMFKAAGFRSAVIHMEWAEPPGHAGALVYLPEHPRAEWHLNGEAGWVWAEGQVKNKSLGYFPPEWRDFVLATGCEVQVPGEAPTPPPGSLETINWLLIVGIFVAILVAIGVAGAIASARKKPSVKKPPVMKPPVKKAIFCPSCGAKVPPDAEFCPECGKKIK